MTRDTSLDRLSDYLDGELAPHEREALDAHLALCASCRQALDDLRSIASAATRLRVRPPDKDLWDGVARRIGAAPTGDTVVGAAGAPVMSSSRQATPFTRRSARRFSFTMPQLAAAGLALMVLSGALVYMARSVDPRVDFRPMSAEVMPVSLVDPGYDAAITDLQEALDQGRSKLDPETVRVLEQNLATIDQAIAQCRKALEADPANAFLNSHLVSARQRKLALLRTATALTVGS
jgi:tetratricopeptide (TPR) repeat protein